MDAKVVAYSHPCDPCSHSQHWHHSCVIVRFDRGRGKAPSLPLCLNVGQDGCNDLLDADVRLRGLVKEGEAVLHVQARQTKAAGIQPVSSLLTYLGLDFQGILLKDEVELAHGVRLHHQLDGLTLANLHTARKEVFVVVAQSQGSNGHHLGDGAEVEYRLLLKPSHVGKHVLNVFQRVRHEVVKAPQGRGQVVGLGEVFELVAILRPDLSSSTVLGRRAAAVH